MVLLSMSFDDTLNCIGIGGNVTCDDEHEYVELLLERQGRSLDLGKNEIS